ncbi:Lipopolysaccharide kinase (Kdo/WaaP) family protein [Salegentibacter echinorum]|uniref:Lipopolysaccharide kinase (Kdo/WaaP) family protein n=1 Tax=Salegentibacter echinorum TaxID=1073325 RepID=A0A1M5F3N5_SALEC|nr:lipopolysaccharide kinase InaA family protein [Salegentibacter echinorum]SHF86149.1 Lipopolysaccharide kinase (Kdo/WaaP) family protein [Salegentibacter echinorum]
MNIYISKYHKLPKKSIEEILLNFNAVGHSFIEDKTKRRNHVKVVEKEGRRVNVKSFQQPNWLNRYVYALFRKSKAERSFEFAKRLIEKGIGTPKPIAYAEEIGKGALTKSFYISEQLDYDLSFGDLDLKKAGHEDILRAFTHFTYTLHEQKIEFLDHSPENTLIELNNGNYQFYLVDLNRMYFHSLNFIERMKNFARLTTDIEKVKIMAEEYAELIEKSEAEVFEKMWFFVKSLSKNESTSIET